jgi:hypothetical protein
MTRSAETQMFPTTSQESRIHHKTAEATCDRLVLMSIYPMLKMYMRKMRTRNITLSDGGCVEDLEALVELFKPHSRDVVKERAREAAWDGERPMRVSGGAGSNGG